LCRALSLNLLGLRTCTLKLHIIAIMTQPTMQTDTADEKVEVINDTHGTNIDPVAEKKLLRKCDIRVLPPLFVLFLLAFLDRTNIGTFFSYQTA
jgi:hypothetical protein